MHDYLSIKGLQTLSIPLADGGEGSLAILYEKGNLHKEVLKTSDPLGRIIPSYYLTTLDRKEAFIELAISSGIELLDINDRNPLYTSTKGTGILIDRAINNGAKEVNLFIGSSSTNDAALGMAQKLGYRFYNQNGIIDNPTGKDLYHILKIEKPLLEYKAVNFRVICDVKNPFFGPQGAAFVYGKQKGANQDEIDFLDEGLKNINRLFLRDLGKDVSVLERAGAAGGIGGGMVSFFNAELISGFEFMSNLEDFEQKVKISDVIITGEGKLDEQSMQGKVVINVVTLARKYHKKVIIVCGINELPVELVKELKLDCIIELKNYGRPNEISVENTQLQIKEASEDLVQIIINDSI